MLLGQNHEHGELQEGQEVLDMVLESSSQPSIVLQPSATANGYCNDHRMNCSSNEASYACQIWDHRDAKGRVGATTCVVIPWFIDCNLYKKPYDWHPLAQFIHDKLPYSRMVFFADNAAFNLTWHDQMPERYILSRFGPAPQILTKPGMDNHEGDHSQHYPGFPNYPQIEQARQYRTA